MSRMKFSNMALMSGALFGPVRAADTRENNGAVTNDHVNNLNTINVNDAS